MLYKITYSEVEGINEDGWWRQQNDVEEDTNSTILSSEDAVV